METKKSVKVYVMFNREERVLIDKIVRKRVGNRTIEQILNEYSYVFDYYRKLFSLLPKVYSGQWVDVTEEYHVLADIISKEYNDPETDPKDKACLKRISDAIALQRDPYRTDLQEGV